MGGVTVGITIDIFQERNIEENKELLFAYLIGSGVYGSNDYRNTCKSLNSLVPTMFLDQSRAFISKYRLMAVLKK